MKIWEIPFFLMGNAINWSLNGDRPLILGMAFCILWLFSLQPMLVSIGIGIAGLIIMSVLISCKYRNR